MERYHALDSLRATMMFLGIILHVGCAYSTLDDVWWYQDRQQSRVFDAVLLYIHLFRMPVFMVMAGFFSALLVVKRGPRGFALNRLKRIGAPFVAGVLTVVPLCIAMSIYGRRWQQPTGLAYAWDALITGRVYRYLETSHLWFLYYLMMLYVVVLAIRWMGARYAEPVSRAFEHVLDSRWRFVVWPGLTFFTLCAMEFGLLDTDNDWMPRLRILLAYLVFYGFGYLLYDHREKLAGWTRDAWKYVLLTLPLSLVNLVCISIQISDRSTRNWPAFLGTALTGAIVVWLMVFGCTGLFVRYFSNPDPVWRYLSDSAYWVFIVHSPVILALHVALASAPLNPFVKFAVVLLIAFPVLLASYNLFVRTTWIGLVLNGRRYPRGLPREAPQPLRASAASASRGPGA